VNFEEAVQKALEEREERNFSESIDLIFNFKDIDLSDPDNRFNEDFKLPFQADDEVKIAVIGDTLVNNAENADGEITEDELEEYFDNPSDAKELADEYSFLIAEAPLMPKIGGQLGQVLGPRNMMPDPMPPGSDPTEEIEQLRNTVTLRLREDPLMQIKVGTEDKDAEDVARNASSVYDFVRGHLEKGDNQIKSILVKTTMGSPVEVEN
jgi:large subunit ribosomal protein L1